MLLALPSLASAAPQLLQAPSRAKLETLSANTDDLGVTRRRATSIAPKVFDNIATKATSKTAAAPREQLSITFFDDAAFTIDVEKVTRSEFNGREMTAIQGSLPGVPFSSATIVSVDGILAANVRVLSRQFQLRYHDALGYETREVDTLQFVDHDPIGYKRFEKKEQFAAQSLLKASARSAAPKPGAPAAAQKTVATKAAEADTIDVMVVYTPQALSAAGGINGMTSRIALAFTETNDSYERSQVTQRVRLVYSGQVSYNDTGDISNDLTALRGTSDGKMDDIHAIRDANGADIVSLWVNSAGNLCGIGGLMTTESTAFAASAFNVVLLACATGNYTFGHEMGHNMGLRHDTYVDTGTNTVTPEGSTTATRINYAHGYVDVANRFRTIMAYTDQCTAAGVSCPKIRNFSNPDVLENGAVTGIAASANNARALNDSRETVVRFRPVSNFPGGGALTPTATNFSVTEGSQATVLVQRVGGSTGSASVQYTTTAGTALAGVHFTPVSGTLSWASGESGSKTVTIPTLQNTAVEGDRLFQLSLSNANGAVLSSTGATVTINDDEAGVFPPGCAMPTTGWSRPTGATSYWQVTQDSASEGRCSLKSISPGDSPADQFTNRAQIQYSGNFSAGTILFDQRVSSEEGWDCLRFYIDGVRQNTGTSCSGAGGGGISGEVAWTRVSVPVTAGAHTLMWSYEKDDSVAIGADAAWIDNLSMPVQAAAVLTVTRTGDGSGVVTSSGNAINCGGGGACSTTLSAGTSLVLTATPGADAVFAGWTNSAGLATCTGLGACAIDGASSVTATARFANRPPGVKATPAVVVSASANPASVSLTSTFSLQGAVNAPSGGQRPTGTTSFYLLTAQGPVAVCQNVAVPLAGSATCSVPAANRPTGVAQYLVVYSGDATYVGASAVWRQVFGDSAAQAAMSVSVSPVKPLAGQSVTVTALVSGPTGGTTPSGVVTFTQLPGCGSATLSPLNGSSGAVAVATCTLGSLAAGNYSVSASSAGLSASASFAVGPAGPTDYTDMWWAGSGENGWGMSITQKGSVQFNALYVYDAQGKPVWYVMPGGSWDAGFTTYSGPIYQPRGAPFFNYDTRQLVVGAAVGNVSIRFTGNSTGVLSYTIGLATGTKNILRQAFGSATLDAAPRLVVNDLWWAGTVENGWGFNIAQSGSTLFAVWYTYAADGNATWFVVPGGSWNGTTFSGEAYTTTGAPWVGATYDPARLAVTSAGMVSINFIDADTAEMRYAVNGVAQTKMIYRQGF